MHIIIWCASLNSQVTHTQRGPEQIYSAQIIKAQGIVNYERIHKFIILHKQQAGTHTHTNTDTYTHIVTFTALIWVHINNERWAAFTESHGNLDSHLKRVGLPFPLSFSESAQVLSQTLAKQLWLKLGCFCLQSFCPSFWVAFHAAIFDKYWHWLGKDWESA